MRDHVTVTIGIAITLVCGHVTVSLLCDCVTVSLIRWALWSYDRQSDALGFVVIGPSV